MTWVNPDCAAGKHGSCAGDAWDDDADERTNCGCPCHRRPNIIEETLRGGFP